MSTSGVDTAQLLQRITDGIVSTDSEWRITYINPAGLTLLGRTSVADLIGQSLFAVFLDAPDGGFQAACERAMRQQTPLIYENFNPGTGSWYKCRLYPAPGGLTFIFADVTPNRQIRQDIKSVQQRLAAIYGTSQRLRKLLPPDQLSQEIIAVLEASLDYSYSAVLLIDETDGQSLVPFALSMQQNGPEFLQRDQQYIRSKGPRVGVGITGWVAQHGQSVCSGDVTRDPRYFSMRTDIHSELCVPLLLQERVIGVVNIETTRPDAYSAEDQELLETIAAQIAISIQNSQLYANTRARLAELEALQSITQALNSSLDSGVIIQTTLQKLQALFNAGFIAHIRVNEATGQAVLGQYLGEKPVLWSTGQEIPRGADLGRLLVQDGALLVPRVGDDENYFSWYQNAPEVAGATFMASAIWNKDWKSRADLPQAAGILLVARAGPSAYTSSDLNFLQSITAVLAVAIQNARLYENLQRAFAEREKTRQMLMQSEKMSALGRVAASLAHEINNPLQAIKGCLTLYNEEMESGRDETRLARYMEVIHSELERVATLVREMREFYRPSLRNIRLVDLNEVLGNVLTLTAKQLSQQGVTVQAHLAPGLPGVTVDPDHFKQIFMNMVLNASEAMPSGGTLTISSGVERPAGNTGPRSLVIQFSDTGRGMSPEVLQHLYEPFYTTKDGGAGLGLYISYGIIQSYGGSIQVTSQENLGANFTIQLPLPREDSEP